MNTGPLIAEIAALVSDPARATMLTALLDGRALTASELAYAARITPQTASTHLAKLTEAADNAEGGPTPIFPARLTKDF
jgi:DNA-binding transcriptional ArsR family regulator